MSSRTTTFGNIKRLQPRYHAGYSIHVSGPDNSEEIKGFYKQEGRPNAVILRDDIVIENACSGDFVYVRNSKRKVIGASATYSMAGGREIDALYNSDGLLERKRRVRELGSVWRWGDEPNELGVRPRWMWITPLFGLSAVNALWQALEKPFDMLICNVHRDNFTTAARIVNDASVADQTPLRWMRATPTDELIKADRQTTSDKAINIQTDFFWASVQHIPLIAKHFVDAARETTTDGSIAWDKVLLRNTRRDVLELDMSDLPKGMLRMMELVEEYPDILAKLGKLNVSWTEARHALDPLLQDDPADPYGLTSRTLPTRRARNGRHGLHNVAPAASGDSQVSKLAPSGSSVVSKLALGSGS